MERLRDLKRPVIRIWGLINIMVPVFIVLLGSGCTRTVYQPVETTVYHTDTLRLTNVRVDSVFQRDSIAVYVNGDTVRITQYRDRFQYRDRTDTVYRSAIDTARIEVPVPVERNLTRWEQTKMDVGGFALGGVAVALCIAVVWLIKKLRK